MGIYQTLVKFFKGAGGIGEASALRLENSIALDDRQENFNVAFGSLPAGHHRTSAPAAIRCRAVVPQEFPATEI